MNFKILLLTTAFVASSTIANASSASYSKKVGNKLDNYYAKIEGGVTMPKGVKAKGYKLKFKNKPIIGIGAGYKFNDMFRSDVMFHYRSFHSKDLSVKTPNKSVVANYKSDLYSFMLNGYLDAANKTIFTPYLMAGIGVVNHNAKGSLVEKTTSPGSIDTQTRKFKSNGIESVWNVGVGCQAKIQEQASIDLNYRYLGLKSSKNTKGTFGSHEVLAGLIWRF